MSETLIVGKTRKHSSGRADWVVAFLVLTAVALLGSLGVVHVLSYSPPVTVTDAGTGGEWVYPDPVSCVDCATGVGPVVRVLLVWALTLVIGSGATLIVIVGRRQNRVPGQDG